MLKAIANYEYGLAALLVMASNPDLTIPSPNRIVGGIGPFDYSGAANPAAVPMSIRIDTNAVETVNINVAGGAVDITAVTVAELVVLLDAAGFTDIDFSQEAVTNRLMVQYVGTGAAAVYMQVYGECARLADIGQGLGCEFAVVDTTQSMVITQDIKDIEKIDIEDAQAFITRVMLPAQLQGASGVLTDTARDTYLRAIIEGGTYNFVTEDYTAPLQDARKIYWYAEQFSYLYNAGKNMEGDVVSYIQEIFKICTGYLTGKTREKNWSTNVYNFGCSEYSDKDNNKEGYLDEKKLTIAEYEALDVLNL